MALLERFWSAGEIIRGFINLLAIVIPAVIFLVGVLKLSDQDASAK